MSLPRCPDCRAVLDFTTNGMGRLIAPVHHCPGAYRADGVAVAPVPAPKLPQDYLLRCAAPGCGQAFRSNYPNKRYCSYNCGRRVRREQIRRSNAARYARTKSSRAKP